MSVIFITLASIFFLVAMMFTVEHANVISISEKPLNTHDKSTARKYFYIVVVSVTLAIIFGVSDSLLRSIPLGKYLLSPVPILMAMSMIDAWLLSYIEPSERKTEVMRRKNFRNALPKE